MTGLAKVSVDEAMARIRKHWHPMIVAELNGQQVKAVKFRGEFIWHHHDHEDELFLVTKGSFRMEFRDRTVTLRAGEMIVVPRGVEHRPVADEEVEVLLFEPASTLNTGNVRDERTRDVLDRL
jgi:mannose-6-phosphate isomerase-like protein (cupin superfamily)